MTTGYRALLFALLTSVFPLTLHAAIPLASPDEDRRAKQGVPPAGKALVYVYRNDGGASVSPTLRLNGRDIGALSPRTYYMVPVAPGRVDLRAGDASAGTLSLRAQDGRIYFIQLSVDSAGDGKLAQVSYGRGRQDVHKGRLARHGKATETAKRAPVREESSPHKGRAGFNLIVKGGSFSLASDSATISPASAPAPIKVAIDGSSTGIGLEGEWITSGGWAFGAEYLSHSHTYTATLGPATLGNGDLATKVVMLNVKKYFRYGATVQPYLGVGIGSATAELSGVINGAASGFASQVMTGVAFRGETLGVYTELKYQSARAEDSTGEGVDAGGVGLFVGVSALF